MNRRLFWFTIGTVILLSGCQMGSMPPDPQTNEPTATSVSVMASPTITATQPTPATPTPSPSVVNTEVFAPVQKVICSPLSGYSPAELEAAVFNPYNPPAAGLDGPHQGVDFADLEPINRYARQGLSVQAVLDGRAASVIRDRFPYGNALMLETPLTDLPPSWLETLNLPSIQAPQTPHPALTCPNLPLPEWDLQTRSLYLLYAHLQQAPKLDPNEPVTCGQVIGAIGNSGNALNPHLHLEIRVGPSGARFDSMAHYDASAHPEEMGNYCTWRVSGIFQLLDPYLLLHQLP